MTVLPLYLVYGGGFSPLRSAHRRPLPGRDGAGAARQRLPRRPLAAPQGGRRRRLRPLRGLQAAAARGRDGVSAIGASCCRPRRQGHPHRAARRDDLAIAPREQLGDRVRRAPRDRHRRRDARAAHRLRLLALAPWRSTRSSSSLLLRDRRPRRPRAVRRAAREQGAADAAAPPPRRRRCAERSALCACRASARCCSPAARSASPPRATPSSPRPAATARSRRRPCSRCCSSAAPAPTCCSPCPTGGSPTGSAAAASCSAATGCCSASTRSCSRRSAAGRSLVAVLGLLGAYYAATDGVLMALGSSVVPDEVRGSGLALLAP